MISKLRWAFGLESETVVEEALREEATYAMMTGMLSGKSKSRRLFFYYQPRESPENWASGSGGPGEEDKGPGTGPRELFATDGLGARLRGRCVWFMRKEIKGDYSPVALDQTNDGAVTFGILDDGVLDSVESVLYACYAPSLGEKKAWGKADPVYAKKFVGPKKSSPKN